MNKKDIPVIIDFLKELDKFKSVHRACYLSSEDRKEDDAQHSWQLAMFVILLKDYWETSLDYTKMLELSLTHDLVELYAGDTFAFDEKANLDKDKREEESAKKLFSQLPSELEVKFHNLNIDYINKNSKEAQYIYALDKLIPKLQNIVSNFKAWKEHNVPIEKLNESIDKNCRFEKDIEEIAEIIMKEVNEKYKD